MCQETTCFATQCGHYERPKYVECDKTDVFSGQCPHPQSAVEQKNVDRICHECELKAKGNQIEYLIDFKALLKNRKQLIDATGKNYDGETTVRVLQREIRQLEVVMTRLQGLPANSSTDTRAAKNNVSWICDNIIAVVLRGIGSWGAQEYAVSVGGSVPRRFETYLQGSIFFSNAHKSREAFQKSF